MSRTTRYVPARDTVARVSSWACLPWTTEVRPSRRYRSTFFQTFSTEPQVVSTTTQPRRRRVSSSPTETPKAGRSTTSSGPSPPKRASGEPSPSRKRMPNSVSRRFT